MSRIVRRHPRLVALAVAAAIAFSVLVIAAARSRTPGGCGSAPPVAQVPDRLRSLGGFDLPLPAGDLRTLKDTAIRAASALHSDLSQSHLGEPVTIPPVASGGHTAVVVPLETNPGPTGRYQNVDGLVAFELDCSGQGFLGPVVDLAAAPPAAFPSVPELTASAALGGDVELVWRDSPVAPEWRRKGSIDCVAATAVPVAGCGAPPGTGSPPSP